MKVRDLVSNQGLDQAHFEHWLKASRWPSKQGMTGMSIDDGVNLNDLLAEYNVHLAQDRERYANEQERIAREQVAAEAAAEHKSRALASMLITSGFSFDGYTIARYSGYISGDDAISMDRPQQNWFGSTNRDVGADLLAGLAQIRRNALRELKEAAYALGCNAVIGVDFDYLTLDPETATNSGGTLYLPFLFAVTANGNAVIIEKNA